MHDLDDLLSGIQRTRDLSGERSLLDRGAELAHHRQGDVGLEQGGADLPHRLIDVGLGQPTLAAEPLEGRGQSVGEGGKHVGQRICRATNLTRVPP